MASQAPSPIVNPPEEDRVYMSRYSDAASGVGRLSISGAGSTAGDMPAQTRSQARRDKERSSTSRAAPANPSRGAASRTAGGESSRRQSTRLAPVRDQRPSRGGDDDSSDDDSDQDDDQSDEDGNDGAAVASPQTPTAQRASPRDYVMAIMSAYEPQGMSPREFVESEIDSLEEPSRSFRRSIEVIAQQLVARPGAVHALHSINPLNGTDWGTITVNKLQTQAQKAFHAFRYVEQDAIATIETLQNISLSVADIFRRLPVSMIHDDCKARLILLLAWMLEQVVLHNADYRSTAATAPTYAGGQNEYNLYLRFATVQANWSSYMNTIRELEPLPGVRALLQRQEVTDTLRRTYSHLGQRYPDRAFPNESVRNFIFRLQSLLRNLQAIA